MGPKISPWPSWKNKKASMRLVSQWSKSSEGKYVLEVYTDDSGNTTEIATEFKVFI